MKKIYFIFILVLIFSTTISAADNHYTITDEEYGVEVHVSHLNYEMMQLTSEQYNVDYKFKTPIGGPPDELTFTLI
ncbi:MAG: hypothetical protein ACOCRO_04890 [Halanaerobiales bacterium]